MEQGNERSQEFLGEWTVIANTMHDAAITGQHCAVITLGENEGELLLCSRSLVDGSLVEHQVMRYVAATGMLENLSGPEHRERCIALWHRADGTRSIFAMRIVTTGGYNTHPSEPLMPWEADARGDDSGTGTWGAEQGGGQGPQP